MENLLPSGKAADKEWFTGIKYFPMFEGLKYSSMEQLYKDKKVRLETDDRETATLSDTVPLGFCRDVKRKCLQFLAMPVFRKT